MSLIGISTQALTNPNCCVDAQMFVRCLLDAHFDSERLLRAHQLLKKLHVPLTPPQLAEMVSDCDFDSARTDLVKAVVRAGKFSQCETAQTWLDVCKKLCSVVVADSCRLALLVALAELCPKNNTVGCSDGTQQIAKDVLLRNTIDVLRLFSLASDAQRSTLYIIDAILFAAHWCSPSAERTEFILQRAAHPKESFPSPTKCENVQPKRPRNSQERPEHSSALVPHVVPRQVDAGTLVGREVGRRRVVIDGCCVSNIAAGQNVIQRAGMIFVGGKEYVVRDQQWVPVASTKRKGRAT